MSEASTLPDILQRLHGEGKFHSSGKFSLDQARAQQVLPLFAQPESFLLKLIQCAHSSRSPSLTFRTQGRRLEAHFNSPALDCDEVRKMVTNLSAVSGRGGFQPAELLAAAVRAARERGLGRIMWGCLSPSSGWGLILENDEIVLHEMRSSLSGGTETFFAVDALGGSEGGFWKRNVPFQAELEAARQRACFAGLPITANGKAWTPHWPGSSGGNVPGLCDRIYLEQGSAYQLLTLPHGPAFGALVYDLGDRVARPLEGKAVTYLQQWRGYQGTEFGGRDLWPKSTVPPTSIASTMELSQIPATAFLLKGLLTGGWRSDRVSHFVQSASALPASEYPHSLNGAPARPSLLARCVFRVPSQPRGVPSRLTWVQNGITLAPVEGKLLMSDLDIYLADSTQATDLSGLKIVQDERWELVVEWIQMELMQLARELRRILNDWKQHGLSKKWVIKVMEAQNLDVRDYEVFKY